MAKLVLTLDDVAINEYPLDKGRITIGRNPGNDILVDDPIVSAKHALVVLNKSPYMTGLADVFIQDLKSTNGTIVNGKKIDRCRLKHADVILIGRAYFRFDDGHTDITDTTAIYIPHNENGDRN